MKIGILSKRTGFFTEKLKDYFENKGHNVKVYTKENLCINKTLLENDLYVMKSKDQIPFVYAGYYAEVNGIPVIPNTEISYKHKNRLEAHLLIKNAGLLSPPYYYGTIESLKNNLKDKDFPLILKPINSSGSVGIKIINSINEIDEICAEANEILYLENFINGTHYIVYFIGTEICTLEKVPLENEHSEMTKVDTSEDIKTLIFKWKSKYNLLFGHLDIVKETDSGTLYIVDSGTFPQFVNWKCEGDPVSKIANLILKKYEELKSKL